MLSVSCDLDEIGGVDCSFVDRRNNPDRTLDCYAEVKGFKDAVAMAERVRLSESKTLIISHTFHLLQEFVNSMTAA